MKKINLACFILNSMFIIGQINPVPTYVTPGYNLTTGSNTQTDNSIIAGTGGYNASGTAQAIVQGVNYAAALPGYQAGSFTNNGSGFASLVIDNTKLRVASFSSYGFTGIPQYDRLEIGVALPAAVQAQIDNFIQTGTSNPGTNINPYDPAQIRVECNFSGPGSFMRHGFYKASDVKVNGNAWTTSSNAPDYSFRIRCEVALPGSWNGQVVLYMNNVSTYISDIFFFTVAPSSKLGPLSMATGNPDVLKFQYPNANIFYGVGCRVEGGVNTPTPNPNTPVCTSAAYGTYTAPYLEYKKWPAAYDQQRNSIIDLAGNGANFIRMRLARTDFPIEEAPICSMNLDNYPGYSGSGPLTPYVPYNPQTKYLTNFSANEKFMWEFDSTLRVCELNNVHILLTLLMDWDFGIETSSINGNIVAGNNAGNNQGAGWARNPYSSLQYVHTRNDFFTDPTAQAIFQKRLYYIEARWGYSSGIAAWEMFNETEQMGGNGAVNAINAGPFSQSDAVTVGNWLCTMRAYLQNGSNFPWHPVTNGTAQQPWSPSAKVNWNGTSPACLDFYTDHLYMSEMGLAAGTGIYQSATATLQNMNSYYSDYWGALAAPATPSVVPRKKGHLVGEYGLSVPLPILQRYSKFTFHNQVWGSLFANDMSNAMQYYGELITPGDGGPPATGAYPYLNPFHVQFKPFRIFTDRISFGTTLLPDRNSASMIWRPAAIVYTTPEQATDLVHTYWMKDVPASIIYGWTTNASSNFLLDALPSIANQNVLTDPTTGLPMTLGTFMALPVVPVPPQTLGGCSYAGSPNPPPTNINAASLLTEVEGLPPNAYYDVFVYDAWDPAGGLITTKSGLATNAAGTLKFGMDMPCLIPITQTNPPTYPDYAFIAKRTDNPGGRTMRKDSLDQGLEEWVYPVPASDKIHLHLNGNEWSNPQAYIIDELGKVMERSINKDNTVGLEGFANGFYALKIKDATHEKTFKIVVQH